MRTRLLALLCLFMGTLAAHAAARATEPADTGWRLHFDNDALSPGNEDRDYTQGFAFTQSGRRVLDYPVSLQPVVSWLDRQFADQLLERPAQDERHSFQWGMLMFTPQEIEDRRPIRDDHPFASLIYIANGRQRIHPTGDIVDYSSFSLGILGTRVGRETQQAIHELIDGDEPRGWRNQISDGGEPTFVYNLARQFRLTGDASDHAPYDLKLTTNASLGYITELGVALSGRWGKLSGPWWADTSELYAYQALPASLPRRSENGRGWNLFGGIAARVRLYNVFLQGQFRDSEVTFEHDELETIVGEAWIGLQYCINKHYRLRYTIRAETDPFRDFRGDDIPMWGSLEINRLF